MFVHKLVTTVAAHLHKAEHIYCMYSQIKLQLGEPGLLNVMCVCV